LTAVVVFTRLFEARKIAQKKTTRFPKVMRPMGPSTFPPLSSANLSRNRSPFIKERSDRGLFSISTKSSLGHRCKKLFFIKGVYEEEDYGLEGDVGE